MTGEPFTPCKLRRAPGAAGGEEIPAGCFLLGRTTAWHVDRVAGRTLHCTRWPLDEVPGDAEVYTWIWAPRPRRSPFSRTVHS